MIEVKTPTLMLLDDGMIRTAMSAASNSAAPVSALGTSSRPGSWPTSGRIRCGATRPMKPIVPVTATAPPTPSATPTITSSRSRPTSTPRDCAVSSPSVSARNALRWAQQDQCARGNERQRQRDVAKAAILQRAEQPEGDFQHHEGIARQVHHQRGRGSRQARDRQSRQDQQQQPGIAPGHRQQHEHRRERRDDRRHRQRVGAHIGKPERDHQHRAEGGGLRRTEQRRRRQRISQQPLQRRAGQSEDQPDRQSEDRARQPDLLHDDLLHLAAAAEQRLDHRQRRQSHRSGAERDQREQRDQPASASMTIPRRRVAASSVGVVVSVAAAVNRSIFRPGVAAAHSATGVRNKTHSAGKRQNRPPQCGHRIDIVLPQPLDRRDGSPPGDQKECGAGFSCWDQPNAVAAPATVSGESVVTCHWETRSWEGDVRLRPASQETCRQPWSHAKMLVGEYWHWPHRGARAQGETSFAVTCH